MNFLRGIPRFLRQVGLELRRVVWPNRQQTIVFTAVVFATVIFISLLLFVTDSILAQILGLFTR
ncbi:MAG: preprotein translocase subunit SecE [Thermaerobacterales bacterium]